MFDMQKFGKSIKRIRENKGLSRVEFSQLISINEKYLSQIESGIKNPSLEVALSIVNNLGIGFDDCYLISNDDNFNIGEIRNKLDILSNDDDYWFLYNLIKSLQSGG